MYYKDITLTGPQAAISSRACFMNCSEGGQHGEKDIHDYFG